MATAIFPKIKKYFESLNLDRETCNPSGWLEERKEKKNAKDYWVRKYLQFHPEEFDVYDLLSWAVKTGHYSSYQEAMGNTPLYGLSGILQLLELGNGLILKCGRHAKKMCRRHGGSC